MSPSNRVISLSVNEEGSLFSACTDAALTVFNMEPLVTKLHITADQIGTVALAQLLHRTNLIALVAGGPRPKYTNNSVLVWDDLLKTFVLEFTFAGRVLSLRTTRNRLFVVERRRIHVFSYPSQPERLLTLETGDNPLGLCEVTPATNVSELQLLVFPGHRLGSVQLLDLTGTSSISANSTSASPGNSRASNTTSSSTFKTTASVSICPTTVSAHQSEVACLALNRTGRLLATASIKGTLIRVFRTVDDSSLQQSSNSSVPLNPEKVAEYRRGLDTVTLYGLLFSPDSEYLLAWSNKGTVHLFALPQQCSSSTAAASRHRSASISLLTPLVSLTAGGEYSISKFSLPAECGCVCAFAAQSSDPQISSSQQQHDKSVYALCLDGTYHKYRIARDGTTCERDNYDNYLEANEESE